MEFKDTYSWLTRIRLCWTVLTTGRHNPKDYKTRDEEKQWQICRQRDRELASAIRPRTDTHIDDRYMEQ